MMRDLRQHRRICLEEGMGKTITCENNLQIFVRLDGLCHGFSHQLSIDSFQTGQVKDLCTAYVHCGLSIQPASVG